MWLGSLLALLAMALTWLLAHEVLQSLARYGEKLEASVSIIAVAVLLVIMNWFFHKTYWTSWLANFHAKKRRLLNGETGLFLGLIALGFTSVYREGFEIVLFLQALVLEGGVPVVLLGVISSSVAVVLVGMIVFRLQKNLPYMKMLILTGILIGRCYCRWWEAPSMSCKWSAGFRSMSFKAWICLTGLAPGLGFIPPGKA
jgi:high-affinity iron transporter